MFNTLYAKIAAGLAGLFFIVGVMFIGVTVFSTNMYQQEVNQKLNSNLARQIVNERLLMADGQINQDALKEIFHMLMVINPGIEIYLLDLDGNILTFSAPKGSVKRKRVDLGPIHQYLSQELTALIQGEDPKNLNRKKAFSAASIERNNKREGYLYVILGGEQYDSIVQKIKGSYILQLSAVMIFAGLLFTLITGLILFALLTGRLKKLTLVMDDFKRTKSLPPNAMTLARSDRSKDEIDRLSSTFKDMALRIEEQMKALQASDIMRRELVANVSHDLRTPIATLQGYIETLLIKENQYSPEQRRQYLEIAIKHCRRLNLLVNDLMELAKLEAVQMSIRPEAFNLKELILDVVQKFKLSAAQKKIRIETFFEDPIDFVHADIALIQRALENLIENAVHYTPENGSVTIKIDQTDHVRISVHDTGQGIDEKEASRIFKRFYQSSRNNEKNQTHSGLGLAITKRIVELHGHQIKVRTDSQTGTCFYFTLSKASSL